MNSKRLPIHVYSRLVITIFYLAAAVHVVKNYEKLCVTAKSVAMPGRWRVRRPLPNHAVASRHACPSVETNSHPPRRQNFIRTRFVRRSCLPSFPNLPKCAACHDPPRIPGRHPPSSPLSGRSDVVSHRHAKWGGSEKRCSVKRYNYVREEIAKRKRDS